MAQYQEKVNELFQDLPGGTQERVTASTSQESRLWGFISYPKSTSLATQDTPLSLALALS